MNSEKFIEMNKTGWDTLIKSNKPFANTILPEYVSKMDFYLETLDRQERKENENPSVGIILCADKDEKVVEYAMSRTMSPTMVAEYKLKLIDKRLLENKLKEISIMGEENRND